MLLLLSPIFLTSCAGGSGSCKLITSYIYTAEEDSKYADELEPLAEDSQIVKRAIHHDIQNAEVIACKDD